jgi:hypothetical protein
VMETAMRPTADTFMLCSRSFARTAAMVGRATILAPIGG